MKRFIFSLVVMFSAMSFAQYSADETYWGDEYYNYEDDGFYFPEEYYYEYPSDYYSNRYYRDFYRDYRRSITRVNWNRFFYEYNLSPHQIDLIIDLNNQFNSYYVWESYYRMNPSRWYYDRFYALERILGRNVYRHFRNRYYRGVRPVMYYTNRCRNVYNIRYRVRPRYRYYDIDVYRVNRYDYHNRVGRRFGWRQRRGAHTGGFRQPNQDGFRTNKGYRRSGQNGFRNQTSTTKSNKGFRSATSNKGRKTSNKGFRSHNSTTNNKGFRNHQKSSNRSNSGFRSRSQSKTHYNKANRKSTRANNSGFRTSRSANKTTNYRKPNTSSNVRKSTSSYRTNKSSSNRGGGFRKSTRR